MIASIAAKGGVTLHPNDDVNMSQSSNDLPDGHPHRGHRGLVAHHPSALQQLHDAMSRQGS